MRVCWNWQTGTFEGRVFHDVRVQVPSLAPRRNGLRSIQNPQPNGWGFLSYRFVIPPFRKKSRLLRLCPCKRGHDASALLPTFCGMREGSNSLLKNTGDFFVSPLHVGTGYARSGFLLDKKQVTRSTVPPLPKKAVLTSSVRL